MEQGQTQQGQDRKPNRLIKEQSPYLLQHAYNPVDWYPWGGEAFEKARQEKKPVFLSIGYSTCHWCHVMAHESFEDAQVAELLNDYFVSVKVDREERPDIDAVYMTVCQAVTGSGGWPLTLVLDAAQNPFFVGTYLPKTSHYGRQGLMEVLKEIHRQWEQDAKSLVETGSRVTEYLKAMEQKQETALAEGAEQTKINQIEGFKSENRVDTLLEAAALWFEQQFDRRNGGFGKAPKFPQAHQLIFLMRYGEQKKKKGLLHMAALTLQAMYRGGIFDQIGGGFSRYSTDEKWLAPHFEKMLYDNAILSDAYLEAFKQTGNPQYKEVVQRILAYVKRELWQEAGGFSCGQDADSEGEEGKYYLFDKWEILDVLGRDRGEEFCQLYNVTEQGNFEGKNILNRIGKADEKEPFWHQEATELLLAYRKERMALHLDDKVLTSWNCLMIGACAKAAACFGEAEYGDMARTAMKFLRENLRDEKGGLFVRWRDNQAAFSGQLEDYAFYAQACLELYEAFGEKEDFQEAVWAAWEIPKFFGDERGGGYFRYSTENESLIIRPKETYDGAIPSGNGVAALVFARLYHMTGMPAFRELRDGQLDAMERIAAGFPAGYTVSLLAFLEAQKEVGMCSLEDMLSETGREERAGAFAGKTLNAPEGKEAQTCRRQGMQYGWAMDVIEGNSNSEP